MEQMTPKDILARLVGFDTTSDRSNLPLIDWVEAYLSAHGIAAQRVPSADGQKASLFAQIGPDVAGGVLLSAHSDVVPVAGQDWSTDPFTLTEQDGKFFGRGTCDMKGFLTIMLYAAARASKMALSRPLQLAISYDEELGCLAAPELIAAMADLPKAGAAFIGEPSEMRVVSGHKGTIGIATHLIGHEVHSSILDRGVSAVMEGAKLIDWANRVNAEGRAARPSALAAPFDPPYTTAHVGTAHGGTADNITAKDMRFNMDMRCVPGESLADWQERYLRAVRALEAEMQAVHAGARIDTEVTFNVPPLVPETNGAAEVLARRLTGDNETHVVSYATEAGQFQEGGYSAVVCGPGNIAQAHQPDEFLSVAQFEAGLKFARDLLDGLAA
ncbi:MAG: acetylornithine deacetylase [Rhodobacterales bacterium]|nr:MAG: acetylornithine deacetylase [Rhodobacterales bacterium]